MVLGVSFDLVIKIKFIKNVYLGFVRGYIGSFLDIIEDVYVR